MNEWIIIAIVGVVLLFSAKKLPDMARGLGQSMRVFKAETRGMKEDEQASTQQANLPPGEVAPGRAAGAGEPEKTDGAPRAGS